ncbi:Ran-binding zinc finger domain-containing protein [Candidatus Chlorohelix sp.]|uniref:zinc finger Ran-binding domain-containing protein n=1 Tax=Candidatus Chlorohelix sp. TaxID=3139201 RepID=UPI00304A0EE7
MSAIVSSILICAPEDQPIRDELLLFLSPLLRQGEISVWPELQLFSDMAQVKKLILEKAHQSDLLVLIVSPEFLDDEFFYTELIKGLVDGGTLRIIPVILKDCLWWETSLEKLSVLPKEVNQKKGQLLPDYLGRKTKRERVLCQVGLDLLEVIKEVRVKKAAQPPPLPTATVTETRHLDAALPSEVEVGERVHILAMLSTETSQGLREYLSNIEKQEAFGIKPEQVVTPGKVEIEYLRDAAGQVLPVELIVRVSSKDFELEKSEERVTLIPQKDSIPCIFPMKPLKLGALAVKLTVSSLDKALFFETNLTTECVATAETADYTIKTIKASSLACNGCGSYNYSDAVYCVRCGTLLDATKMSAAASDEEYDKTIPISRDNPFLSNSLLEKERQQILAQSFIPPPITQYRQRTNAARKSRPAILATIAAMFAMFLVLGFLLAVIFNVAVIGNGDATATSAPYVSATPTMKPTTKIAPAATTPTLTSTPNVQQNSQRKLVTDTPVPPR